MIFQGKTHMDATFNSMMNFGTTITIISVGAGLLITVVVLFFVFRVIGNLNKQITASNTVLMTGVPAQARIVQLMDTGTSINDNPMARLVLEVQPNGGTTYQAMVQMIVPRLKLAQVQPGMTVNVKIDPTNPANVAVALA
jgi:hypothetical protein